jgi:cytochrome oxidase Cu insertion factor (SCO1/SenC/PrrC family)
MPRSAEAAVDRLRRAGDAAGLVALLAESAPQYRGLSPAQATRARGYALAALAATGMPDTALPIVREVLLTSGAPYEIAGAAAALRGHPGPPDDLVAALRAAVDRLRGADPTIDLSSSHRAQQTTATAELTRTLDLLRARPPAGCCSHRAEAPARTVPGEIRLQDQDGHLATVAGRPAFLTFFYTRCDNPYRCSATISRLAGLQQAVRRSELDGAVTLTAITYDPDFDLPERLRRYGRDRGLDVDAHTRLCRVVTGFAELRAALDLGVGYGGATVNNHRIEAYVLDGAGAVTTAFLREQWSVDDALAALRATVSR